MSSLRSATIGLALTLAVCAGAVAQQLPDTEILLVPVFGVARPGAFGSVWITSFTVRNDSDTRGYLIPLPCELGICPPGQYVQAQTSIDPPPLGAAYVGGALFYVDKSTAANFHYSLRAVDTSKNALDAGVEVPVVRESAASQSKIVLPTVPIDARFRPLLRVFDIDAQPITQVRVNIFDVNGGATLASVVLSLVAPLSRPTVAYPIEPGFAQIGSWLDTFPQLSGRSAVRLEVTPVTPGLRFWAFVTITNNDTQHVTVVTPQ